MRYDPRLSIRPDDDRTPPASSLWTRIVDWLGGCRPLSLIAGACGIIALVAMAGHLLS
jgi:hypothetical protein